MAKINSHQSTLESHRGTIVPIYLFCEFQDLKAFPVLGIVNPDTYKLTEPDIRKKFKGIAQFHQRLNPTHTKYSLAVILGRWEKPDEIIMLREDFRV